MSTSPAEAIGNRAIVRRSFGQLADASLGVATTPVEVLNESQIEQGFAALGAAHAIRYDIGTVSTSPAFSRAGVLASYSADFAAVYCQCGVYAGRSECSLQRRPHRMDYAFLQRNLNQPLES